MHALCVVVIDQRLFRDRVDGCRILCCDGVVVGVDLVKVVLQLTLQGRERQRGIRVRVRVRVRVHVRVCA